jgi:hypothetical protein
MMQQSAEEKMVNLAQKLAWVTVKFRSSGRLRPATSHIEKALYATKSIQAYAAVYVTMRQDRRPLRVATRQLQTSTPAVATVTMHTTYPYDQPPPCAYEFTG